MKTTLILLLTLFAFNGIAQTEQQRKKNFNIKNNVAIEGYDPVSYFQGKPVEGESGLTAEYKGIVYFFYSKKNLYLFNENPSHYEPAYGGWCAFAMGNTGEKVKIDPETYKIVEGKLYLFYNFWGNNTLDDWNKKENELKAKGDKNWMKFIP
jgi:YHS domain-containing protein